MIIWLNGTFGAGKTTTANQYRQGEEAEVIDTTQLTPTQVATHIAAGTT
ncbi:hypothetical protein [Nocardia colli]